MCPLRRRLPQPCVPNPSTYGPCNHGREERNGDNNPTLSHLLVRSQPAAPTQRPLETSHRPGRRMSQRSADLIDRFDDMVTVCHPSCTSKPASPMASIKALVGGFMASLRCACPAPRGWCKTRDWAKGSAEINRRPRLSFYHFELGFALRPRTR